ncbi:MAG: FtsQ-type POTRA domain-containing protein [Caldilineaceae bacterium]|nr:FtsQ-type POTRA domain-containing protein [Caldilineaceae bacterium]
MASRKKQGEPKAQWQAHPNRKARRKRQMSRRMRRVEAVMPQIALPRIRRAEGRPAVTAPQWELPTVPRGWTSGWHASKAVSIFLLICAVALIAWLQTDSRWFVYADTVDVRGGTYLTHDDLYPTTGLEGWSIFWVRAEDITENLVHHPYVQAADVHITLPNRVRINVTEAQPIAVWMTETQPLWLLDDGSALEIRVPPNASFDSQLLDKNGQALPVIVDMEQAAISITRRDLGIYQQVMESALTLMQHIPGLTTVRYNRGIGLNFGLPDTPYFVYWGNGDALERKLETLTLSKDLLAKGELNGQVIDVRFENRLVVR